MLNIIVFNYDNNNNNNASPRHDTMACFVSFACDDR